MKRIDFKIGMEFKMSGKRWLCTDVGTRVVVAICLNDIPKDDPSWLNGSPYAVAEQVIDENDLTACSADGFEAEGFDLSKAKKRKTLQDAIDGITPETRHKEIDSGNVGRERFWET